MIGWTNMADGGVNIQNNKAIIHVLAPIGSTINFLKDGIAIVLKPDKSFVDIVDNYQAHWYYSVSPSNYGTWTVMATDETYIASATVTINSNKQYDMILSYHVPPDYQEVEYLASSGTQYIITEIAPKDITRVDCDFWVTTSRTYIYMWGSWDGSVESGVGKTMSAKNTINGFLNGLGVTSSVNIQTNKKYKTVIDCDSKVLTVDGQGYQMTGTLAKNGPLPLALFVRNENNGIEAPLTGRIYYVAFYNGNTLVDKLFPCYRKSDSVAGMWGLVSKTFYTNRGTGTFTVGPDV